MAQVQQVAPWSGSPRHATWPELGMHGLALAILALILWLNLLFWPIPFLGFAYDTLTHEIVTITPGSPADLAGLRPGDRIRELYGRPFEAVLHTWSILPLISPPGVPISIEVERRGAITTTLLNHGTPDPAFQTLKLTVLLVGLGCWLTGYVLGVVRRPATLEHPAVAIFWLMAGGVLGCYLFGLSLSLPLRLLLQWLIITTLIPLAVFIHVWFPVRPVSLDQRHRAWRWLLGSWATLTILGMTVVLLGQPSLPVLVRWLSVPVPVAVLVGFILTLALLRRAYRQSLSAHVRRQVRLLGWACLLVTLLWSVAFLLPVITQGLAFVVDQRLFGVVLLIPAAYLIGGLTRDLYRIDRVLARLTLHGLTIGLLCVLLAALSRGLAGSGVAAQLWLVLLAIVAYRPAQALLRTLIPALDPPATAYLALHRTITQLTTSLDREALAVILATGIRETFGNPPAAVYLAAADGSETFALVVQERMSHLPATLPPGPLAAELRQKRTVLSHETLVRTLHHTRLSEGEDMALHYPAPALWCPVVSADDVLLALLLVGRRGDLDPYRPADLSEVQRVLDAAVLALSNSATYTRQQAAEATIRQLYDQLQAAQDEAAAALVRELHDEVINGAIVLNVQALQRLLANLRDPTLRAELQLVLETEQSVIEGLRMISERVRPTGRGDPLGLEAMLRVQLQRTLSLWPGEGTLEVQGEPVPVVPTVQDAILQIAREALINAVKHAQATQVELIVRYPPSANELLVVSIQDNGQGEGALVSRPGHWGLRSMDEQARAVGGQLSVQRVPTGGVRVTVAVPLPGDEPMCE